MTYSKKQNIKEDQHFVPRFYLKNFGNIIGVGRKEKVLVSFYQFCGSLVKENIPTKSICYKKYFYGKDGLLEDDFEKRERVWSSAIQSILISKSYKLTNQQEVSIKEFVAYQHFRTYAIVKHANSSMQEIVSIIENTHSIEKNTISKELSTPRMEPLDLMKVCDETALSLRDLKISIIECSTVCKFITSDVPVIVLNPFCPSLQSMVGVGTFIVIPISPTKLVALYDSKIYSKCRDYMIIDDAEMVKNLNRYQIVSAEERIIAKCRTSLDIAIADAEAFDVRNSFMNQNKASSFPQEVGRLLQIHSRAVPYAFPILFCAIFRELRKIPKNCRDVIFRTYSDEIWMQQLFKAYRMPSLLKNHNTFSPAEIDKFKDGSMKMLRFMMEYWEIPIKDRTITPELISKINNLGVEYYPVDAE